MAEAEAWAMIPKLDKDKTGCVLELHPIVLCKNCKHRDPDDGRCECGHGIRWGLPRPDDWFCADGERK